MTNDLIFDVGMHRGEDTGYYLNKGYRVIAVDADPRLIEAAHSSFADAMHDRRLELVHCAIGPDDAEIDFHLSETTLWNSVKEEVSTRGNLTSQKVRVKT